MLPRPNALVAVVLALATLPVTGVATARAVPAEAARTAATGGAGSTAGRVTVATNGRHVAVAALPNLVRGAGTKATDATTASSGQHSTLPLNAATPPLPATLPLRAATPPLPAAATQLVAGATRQPDPAPAPQPAATALAAPFGTGLSLRKLVSFAGRSGTLCSGIPCEDPADPSIGVSTSQIVEMTSESMRVTDRAGRLLKETPLVGFFGGSGSGEAEARVVFDSSHARWVAAQRDDDCISGFVFVATSDGMDATGGWTVWAFSRTGYAADMPSIGVSMDKVMVGVNWRAMAPAAGGGCTRNGAGGAGGYVFDASSLYAAGPTVPVYDLQVVASVAAWKPALNVSRGNDLQLIGAKTATATTYGFVYARVTGTLAGESVALSAVSDLTGAGPHIPAWQSADGTGDLHVEWQPLDAIWQSGRLWTAMTVLCTPAGATTARPCARFVGITTGSTPGLIDDITVSVAGSDVFAPGVGLTIDGALVVGWSQSPDAGATVSTYASYRLADDPVHTLRPPLLVGTGAGVYKGTTWGRYLMIAQDPYDPRTVWAAWPYSTAAGGWATVLTQVSLAGPFRYGGEDRFATAAILSAATFPAGASFGTGVDAAYIAYAYNFPDALAGAAAAGTLHGPVLLADQTGTLNASTKAELVRLKPKRIVILGDTGVVGADVAQQLASLAPRVDRYGGVDRFATAALVSAAIFPAGASFGTGVDAAYIAYAYNFPDALAGAAAAGTVTGPILLADKSGTLNPATLKELQRLNPKKIVILGDVGVVGSDVEAQLKPLAPALVRYAGATRFGTAAAISAGTFPGSTTFGAGVDVVYIANAYNFPDGLAAAAAAGTLRGPVLLAAATGALDPATVTELTRLHPKTMVILGSSNAIGADVGEALSAYVPH